MISGQEIRCRADKETGGNERTGSRMLARVIAPVGTLLILAACASSPGPASVEPHGQGRPPALGGPLGGSDAIGRSGLGSQRDLAVVAGDRVFFAYDQSDLSPEAQQILRRQAEWLRRYPNVTVTIEGHTDERGTREYNLSLGERRAESVKNVLIALGIPASQISTISYGKERPEVPHADEQSLAQNRRAVTTIN